MEYEEGYSGLDRGRRVFSFSADENVRKEFVDRFETLLDVSKKLAEFSDSVRKVREQFNSISDSIHPNGEEVAEFSSYSDGLIPKLSDEQKNIVYDNFVSDTQDLIKIILSNMCFSKTVLLHPDKIDGRYFVIGKKGFGVRYNKRSAQIGRYELDDFFKSSAKIVDGLNGLGLSSYASKIVRLKVIYESLVKEDGEGSCSIALPEPICYSEYSYDRLVLKEHYLCVAGSEDTHRVRARTWAECSIIYALMKHYDFIKAELVKAVGVVTARRSALVSDLRSEFGRELMISNI